MPLWNHAGRVLRSLSERLAFVVFSLGAAQSYKDGKYERAFGEAARAYELALKLYGEGHHLVGVRLNMLGILYEQFGELEAARECFERSLEIVRASRGEEHRDYAVALEKVASVRARGGAPAEAEPLYQRALEIKRKFHGKNTPDVAHTINSLALLYQEQARYAEAEALYKELLAMHEEIYPRRYTRAGATARATLLNNLAVLYSDTGDLSRAEACYTQSLLIHRNSYGKKHPATTTPLHNLARFYLRAGDYRRAVQLAAESLEINLKAYGAQHPSVASCRDIIGSIHERSGELREAESCYLSALEINQRAYGEAHPRVADDLNTLGLLYINTGRFEEADACLRRALDISRATWGPGHRSSYPVIHNLALLNSHMGRYDESERLYLEALELLDKLAGEEHTDYATSLENLGEVYLLSGRYEESWLLLKRALDIERRARGPDTPVAASVLNKMGMLAMQGGLYEEAEQCLQKALTLLRDTYGDVMFVEVESNLAGLYLKLGRYVEAEELFRESLRTKRAVMGERHPSVALTLNNLANLYSGIGDYERARSHLLEAAGIMSEAYADSHPSLATVLYNLSLLYYFEGQYAEALGYSTRAAEMRLATLGEGHASYGESLNGRGMIAQRRGDYAGAEEDFLNARRILTQALGPEHPDTLVALYNLGGLYADQGRFEEAGPLFEETLRLMPRALGEQHPNLADMLHTVAVFYASAGRAREALALMERATAVEDQTLAEVMSLGSDAQRLAYLGELYLYLSAFLSLVLRHFPDSAEARRKAYDLVLRRKGLGAEALAAQRDAVLRGRYPELAEPLRRLNELQTKIAERALAGPGGEGPEEHARVLALLEAEKEELEAALARQIPDIKLIRQIHQANSRAVAHVLPEGCVLVEFVRFDDFDYAALPARGEERLRASAYVAFVLGARAPDSLELIPLGDAETINRLVASFTLAITSEAGAPGSLPTDERRLDFDDAEEEEPTAQTTREIGVELRKTVFDPLLRAVAGRSRLLLSPEGDLTRLPFEVLPLDGGRYVIDEFEISYLSTGRDALRLMLDADPAKTRAPGPPLIAAAPDFDLSLTPDDLPRGDAKMTGALDESAEVNSENVVTDGESVEVSVESVEVKAREVASRDLPRGRRLFDPLPQTKVEGESIAAMLGVRPLLAGGVLKQRLKECRSPSILHVATHGFFLPNQPRADTRGDAGLFGATQTGPLRARPAPGAENPLLRSGLALAGANTWLLGGALPPAAENGILTALDVSGLDLLDTELVVLSACVTGLGVIRVGEGVFGLRRAVELAGAKTLIMSLWKVPDRETQALMEDFYRRVAGGQPRASALRDAQLMIKARYNPHPYFWGAFVCNGDPGPLPPEVLGGLDVRRDDDV